MSILHGLLAVGLAAATAILAGAPRAYAASAAAGDPHAIAADGEALVDVASAPAADPVTIGAAASLVYGLEQITGADFSVADGGSGPMIVVGREAAIARGLLSASDFDGLGADGFVIRSVGGDLAIAGATPRGTMFGVNWFLDRRLGVRWYAPDATLWPRVATVEVDRMDERQVPRFAYRDILGAEAENKVWRARNLLNGESHGPSFRPTPTGIDAFDRSWMARGGGASFHELLPPERYGVLNPGWYLGGQVAMMNPAMREAMAAEIVRRMRELPDWRNVWFAVKDMDWGWDMDPASRAFAEAHGGMPSAPRLDMMIDIAERVRRELPGARLAFNAYHWSFAPPEGMTVPDHLLVFPMTIHSDYRTALNEGDNAELGRHLEGWNRIARHVLVWDHVVNYAGFIQPTPNLRAVARSIRWLAGLENVEGYFAEAAWNTPAADFANLRHWLIARLLWNPEEDVEALLVDFTDGYYGPAGAKLRAYIDLSEAAAARAGLRLTEKLPVGAADFDLAFVEAADRLLEEAAALVAGTEFEARVREARMPLDYLVLARRAEYAAEAAAAGSGWQVDAGARASRFWRAAGESRLRTARQGSSVDRLRAFLAVERRAAAEPALAADLVEGEDYFDISDGEIITYGGSDVVADDPAGDGAAVRLDPGGRGWHAQLKLDRLPPGGPFRLFAAVRARGGAKDGEAAVSLGIYPPMSCVRRVPLERGNETWRLVEFPGGPLARSTDHNEGLYMVAGNPGEVAEILVDRILAVPVDGPSELPGAVPAGDTPGCPER